MKELNLLLSIHRKIEAAGERAVFTVPLFKAQLTQSKHKIRYVSLGNSVESLFEMLETFGSDDIQI